MPKVSILMSVYNKGEFLPQAIQSVLDQNFTDFEFIIRDNQSTDNSVEIVESFADERIKFSINSRNLGPVGSMNNCIEAAQGEYIVFAHGDDIWDKCFLETNVNYLENFCNINISHSLMHSISEQGIIKQVRPLEKIGEYEITGYEDSLKKLFKGCYVRTPTAFIRKKAMRYYDVRYIYTCDWDMFLHIAAAGNDFLFINKPLAYYRVSATSETNVGMKGGDMILESYLTLSHFFIRYQQYGRFRRKALGRLSDSILRRSRYTVSRDSLYFFLRCVILCSPLKVFSPIFHLYLLSGLLFGPGGVRFLKKVKS